MKCRGRPASVVSVVFADAEQQSNDMPNGTLKGYEQVRRKLGQKIQKRLTRELRLGVRLTLRFIKLALRDGVKPTLSVSERCLVKVVPEVDAYTLSVGVKNFVITGRNGPRKVMPMSKWPTRCIQAD